MHPLKALGTANTVLTMIRKAQLAYKDGERIKRIMTQNQVEKTQIKDFTQGENHEQPGNRRNKQSNSGKHNRFRSIYS